MINQRKSISPKFKGALVDSPNMYPINAVYPMLVASFMKMQKKVVFD